MPKHKSVPEAAPPVSTFKLPLSSVFLLLVSCSLFLNELRFVDFDFTAAISSRVEQEEQEAQELEQTNTTTNEESHYYNNRHQSSTLSSLPSCAAIMQAPHSPYRDGAFLTRHSIPVSWVPRADGSRELQHSLCELHRYTANEARQCLAGKHVNIIGDSLSRYQFVSLAWFLHKGHYPPHFGRGWGDCTHFDERGQSTCSPEHEPNICMEGDWNRGNPVEDPWRWLMQSVGGGIPSNNIYEGHMEAGGIRTKQSPGESTAECYLYVSPPLTLEGEHQKEGNTTILQQQQQPQQHHHQKNNKLLLSYFNEIGWGDSPLPLVGFDFTGCAYYGNCTLSSELAEQRFARSMNQQWDYSEPLTDALNQITRGILYTQIPPVDISLYNRGLWGALSKPRAEELMPLFHQLSQGSRGKC